MDHRAKLVAAVLVAWCGLAAAGYAQLSPPPGWSAGGGGAVGPGGSLAGVGGAANDAAGGWRASGTLNAGGRAVQIPAAGRFAANAGRYAARGLMLNPLALGVAGAAWLASECIAYQGGQWVLTCGTTPPPVSDGREYHHPWLAGYPNTGWFKTPEAMAAAAAQSSAYCVKPSNWATLTGCSVYSVERLQNSPYHRFRLQKTGTMPGGANVTDVDGAEFQRQGAAQQSQTCPVGWYVTPAGCVQTPPPQPVSPQEVEDKMAPKPIPPGLPQEIPGVPLPIEIPVINPTPGTNPVPQPLRVPQGNPVPVPNTDPQQYRQPFLRVTPAPSPSSPWQVDVTPEDVVSDSPSPVTEPQTVPSTGDTGTPKEDDLCTAHPDIVACQQLGDVQALPVPNETKNLAITKDSGWQENGSCPPAKTAQVLGMTLTFPWTTFCDFASMIRPLLIGFAWLSAALTFMGLGRRD